MRKRVLIIDDEVNIRRLTRLTLETAGYAVGEAENGVVALSLLEGQVHWDAVLLDQKMPGLAGTDVLRRIKSVTPQTAVIMMTAFASVELAVEAMKLGASDFVRKPMTPEVVRNAVAAAVGAGATKNSSAEPPPATKVHFGALTVNGFRVLRGSDLKHVMPHQANEQCFLVQGPDGRDHEVRVEVANEAIETAQKLANNVQLRRAFWAEQAERFLVDFIWNDGNVPSSGKLTLRAVELAELAKELPGEH
jgi:CheY-like chemotaxis protein